MREYGIGSVKERGKIKFPSIRARAGPIGL